MSDSVFCVRCGTGLHPDAQFCQACGGKQPLEATDGGGAEVVATGASTPEQGSIPQRDLTSALPATADDWVGPIQAVSGSPPSDETPPLPAAQSQTIALGTLLRALCAIGAAVAAWFGENAAIHAAGYSGFGGAGWITAILIPFGAGAWVWDKLGGIR